MNHLLLTLNLQEDIIMLNQGIIDVLDHPKQVQIMINESICTLLLRACTIDDLQAVVIPDANIQRYEIGGRSLLKKIRRLTGWEDDSPRVCQGEYYPVHQAILFDLKNAQPTTIPD